MRIILTHSHHALKGFQQELTQHGLDVLHHPLIKTVFLKNVDTTPLLSAEWCFFTSQNAVQTCQELQLFPLKAKVAAVGKKTAQRLEEYGQHVAFIPQQENAQGLVKEWLHKYPSHQTVALAVGKQCLDTIPRILEQHRRKYQQVFLYDTVARLWQLESQNNDIIVLASPSAVAALPQHIGDTSTLLSIGTTTQHAAAQRGWQTWAAAPPYRHMLYEKIRQIVS